MFAAATIIASYALASAPASCPEQCNKIHNYMPAGFGPSLYPVQELLWVEEGHVYDAVESTTPWEPRETCRECSLSYSRIFEDYYYGNNYEYDTDKSPAHHPLYGVLAQLAGWSAESSDSWHVNICAPQEFCNAMRNDLGGASWMDAHIEDCHQCDPAPAPAPTQCTSFEISVLTPGAVCQTVDFQQAQNGRVTFKSGCGYSINSCYVLIAAAGDLDIEHGSEFIMGEDSEVIVDGKLHLNGALRSNGLLTNNNLVVVGESGVLENENDGTFSVSATGSFQNKGTTVNKGNIANSGAATEGSVAGVPYGISNEGELVNVEGAAISNLGTIKNTGSFTNKGEIDNERSPQEV